MIDLDDTTGCPVDDACATCGRTNGLDVATVESAVGVFCLTLCAGCVEDGERLPVLSWTGAIELSMRHCVHLGINADEMGAIMDVAAQRKSRW